MSWKNIVILLAVIAAVHLIVIYGCMSSGDRENHGNIDALEKIAEQLLESEKTAEKEAEEARKAAARPVKINPWIYGENPKLPAKLQKLAANAKSAIIVELNSRKVLYERNSNSKVAIASLTKLMSLLVVGEKMAADPTLNFDKVIKLSNNARWVENAKLRPGEYKFKDLLYGMIVGSYNDAATALAETCCGDVPLFVAEMNQRAKKMGLEHADFNSPSGLPQNGVNSFASAAEVLYLCEAVMKNPDLRAICATPRYTLSMGSKRAGGNTIGSDNRMINGLNVPGAFGFKTGYTNAAGRCVAFGVERNGRVILGCITGFDTRSKLFELAVGLTEWAFKNGGKK